MSFIFANSKSAVQNLERLKETKNYLVGSDPKKWQSDVPLFSKTKYKSVYPGIDILYQDNRDGLLYQFVVAPKTDAKKILFKLEGADKMEINAAGDLVLYFGDRQIVQRKPFAYQTASGVHQPVSSRYVLGRDNRVSFETGNYDKTKSLNIDSVLVHSKYFGNNGVEQGAGIALDRFGNQYVVGSSLSGDFSETNSLMQDYRVNRDIFVAKLKADGSGLDYITYLGGKGNDEATGVAVDAEGNAYVTGTTDSADFPTTGGALQRKISGGTDAFITKISPDGKKIVYSTYLGGNADDEAYGLAIDKSNNVYVTGITDSSNFPLANAFQNAGNGGSDIFLAKINENGTALAYSTYLGGNAEDWGLGIALDRQGNAFVTGVTGSINFPVSAGAVQPISGGASDAFVAKINTNAAGVDSLQYATFLGGSNIDGGLGIAVDKQGSAYITGLSRSDNFPTIDENSETRAKGEGDAFVVKINQSGTGFEYVTLLGGARKDYGFSIQVNSDNEAIVTGSTDSNNLATTDDSISRSLNGISDAFVVRLDGTGKNILFSSYIGGSGNDGGYSLALDRDGNYYLTGLFSPGFRRFGGSEQLSSESGNDNFLIRITPAKACQLTLNASDSDKILDAGGGAGKIEVSNSGNCRWKATQSADWITLTNDEGSGSGTVHYFVKPSNEDKPRRAVVIIGGNKFVINQKAADK